MDNSFANANEMLLCWLRESGVRMSSKMSLVDLRSEGRGRGVLGQLFHVYSALMQPAKDFLLISVLQPSTTLRRTKSSSVFHDQPSLTSRLHRLIVGWPLLLETTCHLGWYVRVFSSAVCNRPEELRFITYSSTTLNFHHLHDVRMLTKPVIDSAYDVRSCPWHLLALVPILIRSSSESR